MKNDEILRIQLSVSKNSSPDLFDVLKKAGRYHQCKRIASLALTGLLAEQGIGVVRSDAPMSPPVPSKNSVQNETDVKKPSQKSGDGTHYSIPDCAAEMIGGMLESFEV